MARTKRADGDPILVKKYANRRLYNTATSSYVTLDDLGVLVSEGEDIKVVDAKTGDDLTHSILAQIILDKEGKEEQMLPPDFLRQLIGLYGNGLEKMVPGYLMGAMENLAKNQDQVRKAMMSGTPASVVPLFEEMTRQNMQLFQNTMRAFTAGVGGSAPSKNASAKDSAGRATSNRPSDHDASSVSPDSSPHSDDMSADQAAALKDAEIAHLKEELAALRQKGDKR